MNEKHTSTLRGETPVAMKIKSPFVIGGNGRPVKEIDSGKTDVSQNRGISLEVDWGRRIIWVHYDNGEYVSSGWTPFENVSGVNYGSRSEAGGAVAAPGTKAA